MKKKLIGLGILLVIFLMIVIPVMAQGSLNVQVHNAEAEPFPDTLGYTVDVYISAMDADGTPLPDLDLGSFRVYQDAKEQILLDAKAVENEAMSLVLLMDMSGSMLGQPLLDAREAASHFLERLGRNDRSAVLSFNDEINMLQNFTSDHFASSEAALQANAVNGRGTCLYDSIYSAMEMTLSEAQGRRAVIVFTDGKDETITGDVCSTKLVEDVLNFSETNRIPVYTIGIGPKTDDKELKRIGENTGGSFIKATSSGELDGAFSKLYTQLNSEYKLTYKTDAAAGQHTILAEANKDNAYGRDSYSILMPVAPTIMRFQSPAEFERLQGEAILSVTFISQSAEISSVVFSCNGQVIGSSVSKPYEIRWDVSNLTPVENVSIEAVAYDKAGAELARVGVPVSIDETPITNKADIYFTSPQQGAEYMGIVTLSAAVSSYGTEVGSVEYYGNGQYLAKVVSPPYAFQWDISRMYSGNTNIDAIAYSKDNKELARTSVMIYIHEVPTPTPEPTEEPPVVVLPEKDSGVRTILYIALAVLAVLVIVLIIVLIIFAKKKKTEPQEPQIPFTVRDMGRMNESSEATMDAIDLGGHSGLSAANGLFATLEVKNSDDQSLIGSLFNVTSLPLTLGRSADNDVVFSQQDRAIGRHHAVLEESAGQITIRDLDSRFGTFINGERIGENPVVLENGAEIRLGSRAVLKYTRLFNTIGGSDEATVDGLDMNGDDNDETKYSFPVSDDPDNAAN